MLSFIVTSLAHWFVCCCISCVCFRFRYLSLYILLYIGIPDDDCEYSVLLERSSLYWWWVFIVNVVSCSLSEIEGSWFVVMLRGSACTCLLSVTHSLCFRLDNEFRGLKLDVWNFSSLQVDRLHHPMCQSFLPLT